jgi:hypothetical protein
MHIRVKLNTTRRKILNSPITKMNYTLNFVAIKDFQNWHLFKLYDAKQTENNSHPLENQLVRDA